MATACCAALGVLLLPNACRAADPERKPNLLLIMADDCTFHDIGCYGGQAHTPNIDKLATEGMLFTHCFQAASMCSPTRHNLYTGLYPVKSGAYPNHTFAKEGTQSVVHYLKPLGYRVALSGKRHIGPNEVFPFEYLGKDQNPEFDKIEPFIKECQRDQTPFCLFLCSNEPHGPWDKGDASRYEAAKLKLPPNFVDTLETREQMTRYLAEITYFDGQVGEALSLLDKYNLAENTLVIVVSEQGSSFPFAKWTCYDSGLQSAFIARWPGQIKPGSVSHAMIEYTDVLPTFIQAGGGKPAPILDGKSLLPVLLGKKKEHKKYVFGEMTTRGILNGSEHFGIRSIRSRQFKYVWNFTPEVQFTNICMQSKTFRSWQAKANSGDSDAAEKVRRYQERPGEELYDVTTDPFEWNNLAGSPQHAQIKSELRTQLLAWMKNMGDLGQQTELDALAHQTHREQRKNRKTANK
ncbi:MAG: sulfatase-like hydrolase/transferase [Planctomycetales bacterium]|nr:sulfatase-like hydrolase/transferase [Planctomycetales bacterium]